MLKKLSEKLGAKFSATTPGCSMLKTTRLDDAFSQASPVEGQSLQQKQEKRRKRKGEKQIPKIEKPKDVGHFLAQKQKSQNFDFCACPSHNALKRDAGGKKGQLLCCKLIFRQIKGNLEKI